jgi:hypothetical protein
MTRDLEVLGGGSLLNVGEGMDCSFRGAQKGDLGDLAPERVSSLGVKKTSPCTWQRDVL